MKKDGFKLLALPTSPYAARLRIQILEKGLDIAFEFPAAGKSAAEHGALNPFARTPILLHGADRLIESGAIAEYLEDLHPEPGMRGNHPLETAHMRAFVRAVDLYLFPLIFRLRAVKAGDPALESLLAELQPVLGQLEALFRGQEHVVSDHMTLADCALLPACFYLDFFLDRLKQEDFRLEHPVLHNWWQKMLEHRSVTIVTAGLNQALQLRR